MYKKRLLDLEIPANLKGFAYLNRGLELYTEDTKMMDLYLTLAEEFNVSRISIEKGMRFALQKANISKLNKRVGTFLANYKLVYFETPLFLEKKYVL